MHQTHFCKKGVIYTVWKVGLLMIPKTCAYMWIIVMGLQLLF